MDAVDKAKIEKIMQDRRSSHEEFLRADSKAYAAFLDLEKKAFSSGELDKMHKELIALGISVVINCESCMEWHVHQALLSGATKAQAMEAVEVGIEMGGGPATVSARFALKALEYHSSKQG
jgi:AhpD family alkylhydroperoxidase